MASEVIDKNVVYWRRKAREGTLTVEEMREALAAIRAERGQAGAVSEKSTTRKTAAKKAAEPIDSEELLKGLM